MLGWGVRGYDHHPTELTKLAKDNPSPRSNPTYILSHLHVLKTRYIRIPQKLMVNQTRLLLRRNMEFAKMLLDTGSLVIYTDIGKGQYLWNME